MIGIQSKTLYSTLVREVQETLVETLNNNFENFIVIDISTGFTKRTPIYFDYNNKNILVGGEDKDVMFIDFNFYYNPTIKIIDAFLMRETTKEEIFQLIKESILEDKVFLDFFEEKSHKLKFKPLYQKLLTQKKLSPFIKLMIESLPHDETATSIFWSSTTTGRLTTEFLFSNNSSENEVINYIRDVAWEQLLNQQKESLNRWLQNISHYRKVLVHRYNYEQLLCLTHYSETVKETELYKEVLKLFKQFTFQFFNCKKVGNKTVVFYNENELAELLSYIKNYGSINFEHFWKLLSETVGEEFEVELTILSGISLVRNISKQEVNEPEPAPEITLAPLKQLQEWKFVKLKLSDELERELTALFQINNFKYSSLSSEIVTHCTLKQIIDLFPTEVSEKVKEYYRLMTQVYEISNIPHFSEFIIEDVE